MQLEDEQSAGVSRPLDKDLARRRKRRAALFAPPRETAGDRPIDMSRIDLCLSFGKHHSVDDAAELAEEMRRVAPHVYVQETVDMPEAERLARIVRTNLENARARKERGFRDALLAAHQGEAWERDYSREERRIVIDSKRVVFYTVEGYSPSEIADWRRALALTQDAARSRRVSRAVTSKVPSGTSARTSSALPRSASARRTPASSKASSACEANSYG